MDNDLMLGKIVRIICERLPSFRGTILDFLNKLTGEDAALWSDAFKRFLRKENPWPDHIIDLDADPFCPRDWAVVDHAKQSKFKWNSDGVELYLDEIQKSGELVDGNELCMALSNLNPDCFNANLLDYLFSHPELIPEEWKKVRVVFWGTVYEKHKGSLHVRFLFWTGCSWCWDWKNISDGWRRNCVAARHVDK